jgi:protein TonB
MVSVDARELIARDIEAELGDDQTPMAVAEKPVSKKPIREVDAPSYTPPSPPIELGEVRSSSPASGGSEKQTDLSDAIARSVQWTTDSHRDPLRYLLLAVACIIAGLALSVFSLWYIQKPKDREPRNIRRGPASTADSNVEASAPSEPSDEPLDTDGESPPERRSETPRTETAAVSTEKIATSPTSKPARPKVETSTERPPPRPVSQPKPVRSQPAETEPEPAVELPSDAAPLVETDVETIAPPTTPPAAEMSPEPAEGIENPVVVESPPIEPPVQRGDLVEPASDVIEPVLLEMPKLHYPKDAKRRKLEAVIRVRVLVDENGRVIKAEVVDSVGHGFDEAALSVAVRTQFIPATKGTMPVKMWTTFPIVYRLKKK